MKNRKLKNSELERISPSEFKEVKKTPIIVVLDNIRSLNNIGSVFRTADAFLIEKIVVFDRVAVSRTAAGEAAPSGACFHFRGCAGHAGSAGVSQNLHF